jgi:hypothetical protein
MLAGPFRPLIRRSAPINPTCPTACASCAPQRGLEVRQQVQLAAVVGAVARAAAKRDDTERVAAAAQRPSMRCARSTRRSDPQVREPERVAEPRPGGLAAQARLVVRLANKRPTVSTTLSKLAKNGEVQKAERGYRLAAAAPSTPSSPAQ